MENLYYWLIIWFVVFMFIFDKYLDYLNTLNWSDKLPDELKDIYDEEKYKKSQEYEKEKYKFSKIESSFSFLITILVLSLWWFWYLDGFVREYTTNPIYMACIFFAIIILIQTVVWLPFARYNNFVIEEKFGFNKMTNKLFVLDTIKWLVLMSAIWWVLMSSIIRIYSQVGQDFWYWAWLILTSFSIFFMMFYSTLIVPLFNKQEALEDGDLRKAIEDFATKVWFQLDNIFVIDGSKRSTKANAYFSGFGPKKRIVLFDTLIEEMTTEEIVAVLAHEIWHYKKKHTLQMLFFSILQTWFILYLFAWSLGSIELARALWADAVSFHIWTIAFSILFTPISLVLGILMNIFSRKNEYEADAFAGKYYKAIYLQTALKKLSVKNLSNMRPHPAYEFVHYSHPTVLKRLEALR